MTEQEQKAFTAMREALEQVEQQWAESGWGFRESIRTTVQQALTAANAVTSECSKVTSEYSEQPEPPSDENIADAWISASDSDGIAYDGPSFERGYRLGRGEYDEYTGALVAAAKAEALAAANAVSVEPLSKQLEGKDYPADWLEFADKMQAANAVSRPQATEPACKTCKHFTQGKNPLVGTYEMQCFECCNYYASKWEERDAHHE